MHRPSPELAASFCERLAARVAERATGSDASACLLVARRPAEHVIAGFLTPRKDPTVSDLDERADEPYELTNVGVEWLVPRARAGESVHLEIQVSLSLYVRLLPTFAQAKERTQFSTPYKKPDSAEKGERGVRTSKSSNQRKGVLPEVWRRIEVPPLSSEIRLSTERQTALSEESLMKQLRQWWREAFKAVTNIYPSFTLLSIEEGVLESEDTYVGWIDSLSRTVTADRFDWSPLIDVRCQPISSASAASRIAVRLVNGSPPVTAQNLAFRDPNLYDARLSVRFPADAHCNGVFRELEKSYRYDRSLPAVGLNAHVETNQVEHGTLEFRTVSVPVTRVPRLRPRELPRATPSFSTLAREPVAVLRRIEEAMRAYDAEDWQKKEDELFAGHEGSSLEVEEARKDRGAWLAQEVEQFGRSIGFLEDPRFEPALRAFTLMNKSMATLGQEKGFSTWHLFQIVFIVRALPDLARRYFPQASDYLAEADKNRTWVDVLWFAAGGGKTEAFLGLILWHVFLDRLVGKSFGMTALLRFPLRLLTFQQLQRLARTLAVAEMLRVSEGVPGEPFSLGYFVGGSTTPNSISNELHDRYKRLGLRDSLKRLSRCPYCGSKDIALKYDEEKRQIQHLCESSRCPQENSPLPLYIVDDDLYRYLPTVVVSTVDKLANLGQNRRFSNLFGRIDRRCEKHGCAFFTSNSFLCEASKAAWRGEKPEECEGSRVEYGPFKHLGPSLQIADEMHLLREELGTFDGHYETACFETLRSLGMEPWKVIGATATIERYDVQARHLYLSEARRFPSPGPSATHSFYYRESADEPGRFFLGVLGVGRAHTPAVTSVVAVIQHELEFLRRLAEEDPEKAGEIYGLPSLDADNVKALLFLYELLLVYVLTLKGGDQVAEAIETRVKGELAERWGSRQELIVRCFNSGVGIAEMIDTMEEISHADADSDPYERVRCLVTTNIISHGVDIERFGAIVFAGFPRQVAEYIQASARVGRSWPGISIIVPTPQNQRDRSVLDRFAKFHEYVDRLVEPTTVNRWPEPVLQRTLGGLLAGYLMSIAAERLGCEIYTVEKVQELHGMSGADCLDTDEVVAWLLRAVRADEAESQQYREAAAREARNLYERVLSMSTTHDSAARTQLRLFLDAMRSLRDVDQPAFISIEDEEEQAIFSAYQ